MSEFQISIVINTKNRREELGVALNSCLKMTGNFEVIVIDDGSEDGTAEFVRSSYPKIRLYRSEQSEGLIAQRNRGAEMASSNIVVVIDDDAVFSSPDTLQRILAGFVDPVVAAVALTHKNHGEEQVFHLPPDEGEYVTVCYVGTAHALRRDVFLKLGGYRATMIRQGEEVDYCLRLYDAGYRVGVVKIPPIIHNESPVRNKSYIAKIGIRNSMLFYWWNVPSPYVFMVFGTIYRHLIHNVRAGRFREFFSGLAWGFKSIRAEIKARAPVQPDSFRRYLWMKKHGMVPLKAFAAWPNKD